MRVAVLGGGFQGCCIALALAAKGVRVALIDRNDRLLSRAAVANEGKIHLGYMYAGDRSRRTAKVMMTGALAFEPFLRRHLDIPHDRFAVSAPAVYLVHRRSQQPAEEIQAYLAAIHRLVEEALDGRPDGYFGMPVGDAPLPWAARDREAEFDGEQIVAAFQTPEIAINPVLLSAAIRERIEEATNIDVRLAETVTNVRIRPDGASVDTDSGEGRERFDHVVNALWDGRLAIDAKLGFRPQRPWLHRLKYGVGFRPPDHLPRPRSVTIVLGPFGEVVNYRDGLIYLTWYPDCVRDRSDSITPPDWPIYPGEPLRSSILQGTLASLSELIPALRSYHPEDLTDVVVRGGDIVAWGTTDIDDPQSELHRRFEIGVTSRGRYHSVDPGKLTMAPYFAGICAERIIET
jgi:glycine/D-amino acid oxidase-like deaminating enzyme